MASVVAHDTESAIHRTTVRGGMKRRSAKSLRIWLFASVSIVPLLIGWTQAQAACDPAGRSLPSNTTVTCTGTDSQGSRAGSNTTGVSITVDSGATVTRSTDDSERVLSVFSESSITNNGTVTSIGDSAHGMEARAGNNILVNNGLISTTGPSARGMRIRADGSGSTIINNGTITTSGHDGDGMDLFGSNNIAINNGTISLTGIEADGMQATGDFLTVINTGSITTRPPAGSNQDTDGIIVRGNNNTIRNTGTIDVDGKDSHALDIVGTNNTAVNEGVLIANGLNESAVYFETTAGQINSLVNTSTSSVTSRQSVAIVGLDGDELVDNSGTVTSGSGPAIQLQGGNDVFIMRAGSLNAVGPVAVDLGEGNDRFDWISGGIINGQVLMGNGDDVANLEKLDDATLQFTPAVDGGFGTDTITLANVNTSNPGRFINWETINLITGSQLTMGSDLILGDSVTGTGVLNIDGTSTVIASNGNHFISPSIAGAAVGVNNAGLIDLAAGGSSVGDRLTINGNYTGSSGELRLNTVLGDDNSATDMLIVTGDTAGNTLVDVVNVNGTGAITSEGIRIINVNGASDGLFTLLGDYEFEGGPAVVGGAYAYRLYKGGVSTPNDGDWYLRSAMTPVEPEPGPEPEPEPGEELPLYQPGVPVYEAYPQLLLGLNGLPTLQQRVGNRYWSRAGNVMLSEGADPIGSPYAPPQEAGVLVENNGIWGRVEGMHTSMEPRFSTSRTDYNFNTFRMQAGLDGLFVENENGKLIGGVTVHYVHGKAKTRSVYGDGEISTDGYGLGGTLTWYGESGFYVDGQAQATWYKSDLNSMLANLALTDGNDGFGYALSLESGKRVMLNEQWSVTPQAQLVYSNVDFDSFNDVFDATVDLNRGDSLQGRLGLSIDRQNSWYNDKGLIDRTYVYGIANLYYEFLDGTKIDVSGTSFTSRNDRFWAGIGLGTSYNWNSDKYSLYGEGSINTSLSNFGDSYAYKGTVGFRVKW